MFQVAARLEAWASELAPTADTEPASAAATAEPVPLAKTPLTVKARPEVVLKQYAWDQTSDAVKIYASIAGVGEPGANVEVSGSDDEAPVWMTHCGAVHHAHSALCNQRCSLLIPLVSASVSHQHTVTSPHHELKPTSHLIRCVVVHLDIVSLPFP